MTSLKTALRCATSLLLATGLLAGAAACVSPPWETAPNVRGVRLDPELARTRQQVMDRFAELNARLDPWTQSLDASPEVAKRLRQIAEELREEVKFTLEQERVIASRQLEDDPKQREFLELLYAGARNALRQLEAVMTVPPPETLACLTDIRGEGLDDVIHYISRGDLDHKSTEWTSYQRGSVIEMGKYVFRVTPPGEVPYLEQLLIISDPFRAQLKRPRRAG